MGASACSRDGHTLYGCLQAGAGKADIWLILPAALFVTVASGTPGTNNVILAASGADFGYWRTLPDMFEIVLGLLAINLLVAAGLGVIFRQSPIVQQGLKMTASIYLLYLARKIASIRPIVSRAASGACPMRLMGALCFN